MKAPNPNLLLVEGLDDRFVVAELFEQSTGITWEPNPKQYLVDIEWCGNDIQVLEDIGGRWKESGRKILGVVIDADSSGTRLAQVRSHAPDEARQSFPEVLPPDGLVIQLAGGRRFGVWLMPDNQSSGMMETFLKRLRTSMPQELGDHVVSAMSKAQELMNASLVTSPQAHPPIRPWRDPHRDKAELHTWLAWQDPPGLQLHEAVMKQLLDVQAPQALAFVEWMRRLYGL